MLRTASKTLALLALALPALAGPLDPPAGPIAPTGKTLSEIEPRTAIIASTTPGNAYAMFVIDKPGSYYLTGNFTVTKPVGIYVQASDVTIDLNGFTISAGPSNSSHGIQCSSDGQEVWKNVSIRNGNVSGAFVDASVDNDAPQSVIENINVRGSTDYGIVIGSGAIVRNCTMESCRIGMAASAGTIVENCVFRNCTDYGASVGEVSIRDCSFSFNNVGIYCYGAASIESNFFRYNGSGSGSGLLINGSGAVVQDNSIIGSYFGIQIGSGATDNLVVRNTVRKGGATGSIIMNGQAFGNYPNNHVATVIVEPTSPVATTNPLANIQY